MHITESHLFHEHWWLFQVGPGNLKVGLHCFPIYICESWQTSNIWISARNVEKEDIDEDLDLDLDLDLRHWKTNHALETNKCCTQLVYSIALIDHYLSRDFYIISFTCWLIMLDRKDKCIIIPNSYIKRMGDFILNNIILKDIVCNLYLWFVGLNTLMLLIRSMKGFWKKLVKCLFELAASSKDSFMYIWCLGFPISTYSCRILLNFEKLITFVYFELGLL